jgi:hypothetical protein
MKVHSIPEIIADLVQENMWMRAWFDLKTNFLIKVDDVIIDLCSIPRAWNKEASSFILWNDIQTNMSLALPIHLRIYGSSKLFIWHQIVLQYFRETILHLDSLATI